jgi:ribosomal protein S6--L-glutamate ligase
VAEFLLILSNTLGQPTMIILKNYIKTQRKQVPVCVLSFSLNPELYSNKRIMEAGEMRGHEMHFLNIKECYMRLMQTPKYIIEEESF